jgi:hypothetical protein
MSTRKGTRTANNLTGTAITSNNSTLINTNTTTTWATSTNTTPLYTNYTYKPPQSSPFSLSFHWEDKSVNISLKNGNDIFKLANAFMEWLDKNEIEYEVKTSGKKKKK